MLSMLRKGLEKEGLKEIIMGLKEIIMGEQI